MNEGIVYTNTISRVRTKEDIRLLILDGVYDASGMRSERSWNLSWQFWSISMNDLEMSTKMFIFMNVV